MIGREHRWGPGILLGLALVSCLALPGAWAEGPQVGQIGATQGTTQVMRAGQTEFAPIGKGEPVFVQDTIGTEPSDANAKLWWTHPSPIKMDGSLGRNSSLGFESYSEEGPASSFEGSVSRGMVRFIRQVPVTQPESSFTTITPTSHTEVVPTDRAADYVVSVIDENRTSVTVIWGEVVVRNLNDQIPTERHVTSCQMVIVERDKEPSEVMQVGSGVLRALIRQTTIPGTLPTDVPSCATPAQPVPADQVVPPEDIPDVIEGIPADPGIDGFWPIPIPFPPGSWTDTSWTDTSWTDTSWTDTSWTDTSYTDTSWTDTSYTDTSWTDTSYTDTSYTDTSYTDTSYTDTSWTDTSYTDTGTGAWTDTGTGAWTDTGTGAWTDTGTGAWTDTGTGAWTDTGTGAWTDTGTGMGYTDTGTGVGYTDTGGYTYTGAGYTGTGIGGGTHGGTLEPFSATHSTGGAISTGVAHTGPKLDKHLQQLHKEQQHLQKQHLEQFKPRPGI